jgi:predicted nucleotide-binding protein
VEAKAVTRQFLRLKPKNTIRKSANRLVSCKDIFVVHGRDARSVNELKNMLIKFGLNPIVLHEQPSGSRTVVEKLEKYSDVGYAFVILTPDDIGCFNIEVSKSLQSIVGTLQNLIEAYTVIKHKGPLKKVHDELSKAASSFKPRARQNVVLEFGYFIGFLGRDRVCCLYKGDVELPSDMHGIVYVPFKESVNEARDMIIKELRAAGYDVKG